MYVSLYGMSHAKNVFLNFVQLTETLSSK